MMDIELKTKWTTALRSGEYVQGHGQLYDPEDQTHCCLGVLCRVADLQMSDNGRFVKYQVNYATLEQLMGLSSSFPLFARNDGIGGCENHSFSQIADWIDENL